MFYVSHYLCRIVFVYTFAETLWPCLPGVNMYLDIIQGLALCVNLCRGGGGGAARCLLLEGGARGGNGWGGFLCNAPRSLYNINYVTFSNRQWSGNPVKPLRNIVIVHLLTYHCMSLYHTLCYYMSLYVTIYHWMSLYISLCYFIEDWWYTVFNVK